MHDPLLYPPNSGSEDTMNLASSRPRPRPPQRFSCERSTGPSSCLIIFKSGMKVYYGKRVKPIDFGVGRSPGCHGNHDIKK